MDPTTEDIFFSAEAFRASSAFATARDGMKGGKMIQQQQQQQQQKQSRNRQQQQQQMEEQEKEQDEDEEEDEEEEEEDGEMSDMLLSDMDSGIFFNEASVAFFGRGGRGGGGEGGLQKHHQQGGQDDGDINTSKLQQQQQQQEDEEEGDYSSPLPSFPHALLSSKNVSSLPSTVHSGLSSFLAAGPPLWKQPAPGVSHHYQQQEEQQQQQQQQYGSQYHQLQQHNQQQQQHLQQQQQQLSVSMPGFGFENTGGGKEGEKEGGEGGGKGGSESLNGLMDDTASILSSDSSSIWGVDPQEGRERGRSGGGRDNTIPPQYQMNHNASSLMMMFPSPGSSSATSAVSGVSSGSNSANSGNSNGNLAAAAAAPSGGAILLPPGVVKKGKAAGGGGTRRKLGGGGGGSSSSSSSGGGGGREGGSVGAQAQALSDAMAGVDTTSLGSFFSSGAEGGGGREGGVGGGMPTGKRKQDRNAREQKRSLKISQQIGHLKTVLEKEGRKVKKNSKMAILLSVEDYIKELEEEIAGMTLMGGGQGGREGGKEKWGGICTATAGAGAAVEEEARSATTVVTVVREREGGREVASGVGYQSLFKQVSTPLAVASVDGRLIDVNVRFEMATGYSKEELSRLTFFNLVAPEDLQATFAAVAQMINQDGGEEEDGREEGQGQEPLRLTRRAMPKGGGGGGQGGQLYITISLVKQQGQSPSFFQCSLH